jgi:serine/threonine-protein kinase
VARVDSVDPQDEDPESTLPPTAGEAAAVAAVAKKTDRTPRIAGHEIMGILGEGGMGIVYKARHVRLNRVVALKMIRPGVGARSTIVERFEAEARAVAAISHPNIVRIFEIGEHEGFPYFSLEFLAGGNLHAKIGGKPKPAGEAARIVEILARAVLVAHHRKIIHRDLKPANVLIDEDGTLKISDFGLVKELESDSGRTNTGAILGTPSYMAPEQARGEASVGPAADQYALGAILYELLTGRPPFHGPSTLETLDMVRKKDPVPPSQLQPKLALDIETICLKCLEKEPARRYADVGALADDLERFQKGEPIVARPVSRTERLWRWCLRNQRVAALAATVAFLLVAGSVASGAAAIVLSKKNTQLEIAKTTAEEKQKLAEIQQKRAEDAARAANKQNVSLIQTEQEWLQLLLGKLRYVPAIEEERGRLMDNAVDRLKEAAEAMTSLRQAVGWEPGDEEHNLRLLASAHQRMGEHRLTQGRVEDAVKHFEKAAETAEGIAATRKDDLATQLRLARIHRNVGFVKFQHLADSGGALKELRRALEISRACAAASTSDTPKVELANSLGQVARVELALGHLDQVRQCYDEELAVRDSFTAGTKSNIEIRRQLAGLYEMLGLFHMDLGEKQKAKSYYDKSLAIREQVLALLPNDWPVVYDIARSLNNSGYLEYPDGDNPKAAREYHRKAAALIEKRLLAEPDNFDTKARLAETLYYEATCALQMGDKAGSDASYERCLQYHKELARDPKAKSLQADLMLALARCGDHAEAAKIAESLVATPPRDENLYYRSACGYALASAAVRDDSVAKIYRDAAVRCLQQAKARGWNKIVSLQTDPDLEPIRKAPEFQVLLAEFRKPADRANAR